MSKFDFCGLNNFILHVYKTRGQYIRMSSCDLLKKKYLITKQKYYWLQYFLNLCQTKQYYGC